MVGVNIWFTRNETDGGADVRRLIGVVHRPTDGFHLEGHLVVLVGRWLLLHRHELALALSPATVIEGEHDVTFLHEDRTEPCLRASFRAAGARAENDGRKLVSGLEPFRQIKIARHACAIAKDGDGSLFHRVRQRLARSLAFRCLRGGGEGECSEEEDNGFHRMETTVWRERAQ